MTTLQLHVADESDMAARFIAAWKRAEQGDAVNERHLTFLSLRALLATLTPERLALLRHLRRAGGGSVDSLAEALQRNPDALDADVDALVSQGLLSRDGERLTAPWDRLSADLIL